MIAAARRADTFALLFGLVILASTTWPYLAGYHAGTPDLRFAGFIDNPTDANPYVSWIRQAADGRVMIESRYSPEPVPAHLFNLMTLALGLLARVTGMSPIAAWHAGRVAFGAALLAILWWACGVFATDRGTRRFAYAWMAAGAGLGWWFVLTRGRTFLDPPRPLDLRLPEASAFYSILTFPHLALSMALMVAALVTAHLAVTGAGGTRRARHTGAAAAMCIALAAFHPYPLVVIAVTLVLELAILAWRRSATRDGFAAGAAVVLAAGLGLGWNAWMFSRDVVLSGWKAQNVTPSLHPLQYLLGLGPALWLAPWAAIARARRRNHDDAATAPEHDDATAGAPAPAPDEGPADFTDSGTAPPASVIFLGSWIAATLALIYAPLPFQRRLVEGVSVPLVLLAVLGLDAVRAQMGRTRPARSRAAAVLVAAIPSAALLVSLPSSPLLIRRSLDRARSHAPEYFMTRGETAAYEWLRTHAPAGSVVLAMPETSNRIPRFTDCRVFAGHFCQTANFAARAHDAQVCFSAPVTDRERENFVRASGIDYVFIGPAERRAGAFDPERSPEFQLVFRQDETAVYGVNRNEGGR